MWRSSDGAASWELVDTRLGSSAVRAVAGDPLQPGTVMTVGCGGYETVDGGDHWYAMPGLSPADCSFDALQADPTRVQGFFASGNAGLYRTTFGSGGIEWAPLGQDRFTGETHAAATRPFPPTIIAAPSSGGLFVTRDGGSSWSAGATPPARVRQLQESSSWAFATTDGGLFVTFDGSSWQDVSGPFAGLPVAAVFLPRDRPAAGENRVSYAAAASGVFRSVSGWESFSEGFPAGGARTVLADRIGRMVYALPQAGEGISVYRYPFPTLSVIDAPLSISSTRSTALRVRIDPPQPVEIPFEISSSDESVLSFPPFALRTVAGALVTEAIVVLNPRRAEANAVTVTIRIPTELGGASVSVPVQVLNPRPVIGGVFPRSVTAGAAAFNLNIADSFQTSTFAAGIQAYWNGSPRPARLVPPTVCPGPCPPATLVVSVTANDIASPGAALVTVVNPPPGGGAADPFQVTIAPVPPREAIRPDAPKIPREPRPLPPRSER
jgi:photosystem II stability/assembly factor-like uncharacterized protein